MLYRPLVLCFVFWGCLSTGVLVSQQSGVTETDSSETAVGVVFEDSNRNGQRDQEEPGLPNVRVSNGCDIVETDHEGRYELPITEDGIVFVVKPKGWATPVDSNQLPQFYYVHKPNGSPANFRFKGVEPTGPLPASVDFPLHRQKEPDQFRAILFGDPQPRNQEEVAFVAHDVIEELIGAEASFGVTLGDIAFDDLSTFKTQNEAIALIGIPWYNVIGNHDLNMEAKDDAMSDETFESVYGPTYYSFDYGQVHFVVIDNVEWFVETPGERGKYRGGIGPRQIKFIQNDLAQIPNEQMVVLMMHIPITNVADREGLYRLIEDRPFCMSISGHTHHHEHRFLKKQDGWKGAQPHHHIINVTVSGSWWSGAKDERGIPHTQMADGAPNGYSIVSFDGKRYRLDYKAAGRDEDYQMQVFAPSSVTAGKASKTMVFANIFNGSENTQVEMKVGDSDWIRMRHVLKNDPAFEQIFNEDRSIGDKTWLDLPKPKPSTHLWQARLPKGLEAGTHLIEIRGADAENQRQLSQSFHGKRVIRVVEPKQKSNE